MCEENFGQTDVANQNQPVEEEAFRLPEAAIFGHQKYADVNDLLLQKCEEFSSTKDVVALLSVLSNASATAAVGSVVLLGEPREKIRELLSTLQDITMQIFEENSLT